MPTNLTAQAKAKWAQASAAKDPEEKIRLLREFYSLMPHHKGTERLEMSIKRQISSLQETLEARSRKKGSTRLEWIVKKEEGSIQVAIVGKATELIPFFNDITGLRITIKDLLERPVVGNFKSRSVLYQTIPLLFEDGISPAKLDKFLYLGRNTDILLTVSEEDSYVRKVIDWFEGHNIDIVSTDVQIKIERTSSGGIRIVGGSEKIAETDLRSLLDQYAIKNAVVKVSPKANLDDVEAAVLGRMLKRSLFVTLGNSERLDLRKELVLSLHNFNKDILSQRILDILGLIRVFTKPKSGEPALKPLIMRRGCRIIEIAEEVHKDMARTFQYARIWRNSGMEGVRVGRNFIAEDGDIVEIHSFA